MKNATPIVILGTIAMGVAHATSIDYCDREIPSVTPGKAAATGLTAPSDAIVLFDGRDLSQWQATAGGGVAPWEVNGGILTVKKGSGDIQTKRAFHDFQLHVEWRVPTAISGEGQHRGNSGVFLLGRYEIQVLDSYHSRTYADGQAGAIFGQEPPLVNAMRPPGEWNTYDVIFTAPRFYDDGKVLTSAHVTLLHNGVLIQNNSEVLGSTGAWGRAFYHDATTTGPIRLQDHPGPDHPISYRNIWLRELNVAAPAPAAPALERLYARSRLVSTKTVGQLLENPATRAVLWRCVPELIPAPDVLEYVNNKTLEQLQGEADITLNEEKLERIEAQLVKAQAVVDQSGNSETQ